MRSSGESTVTTVAQAQNCGILLAQNYEWAPEELACDLVQHRSSSLSLLFSSADLLSH